jgi:hypothetical protein
VAITIEKLVKASQQPSPWDLGNRVLYDLCKAHPGHRAEAEIVAKIWLIGRAYAAAIERRKNGDENNDNFYLGTVAPSIRKSDIDRWLGALKKVASTTTETLPLVTQTHQNVMNLFEQVSGLNKRSLASKYLHFHYPNIFFIYDSRACNAMRMLKVITGRAPKANGEGDNEYRKFVIKCVALREYIKNKYRVSMTPRQLDTLLLLIEDST